MTGTLFLLASGGGCKLLKPQEKKPFAAECTNDTDCESLQCSTYGSICTKSCTYDTECGGDLVCRDNDKGVGQLCAKPVGAPPNGVCQNPTDCQHGHCLKRVGEANEPGICSKFCQTSAECPDKMKICESISDSGLAKYCLPGDEKTPAAARPKFAPPPKKATTAAPTSTALANPTQTVAAPVVDAGTAAADAGKPADAGATDAGGLRNPIAPKPTATAKPKK
jgi:hypothetical protein